MYYNQKTDQECSIGRAKTLYLGKIKLSCYTLLQASCDNNLQAYTMFI